MDEGNNARKRRRIWTVFRQRKQTSRWWKLFRWKSLRAVRLSFIQDAAFRIASFVEAVVLVVTLCFFYLCCGCNF